MQRSNHKLKFWTVLAIVNIAAIVYPMNLYANAEGNDQQGFAVVILLGIIFLLAIVDLVSAIVAYL